MIFIGRWFFINIVDRRREWKHNMILLLSLLFFIVDLRKRLVEEKDLLSGSDTGYIFQSSVDKVVKIRLEFLVFQKLFRRVFFCTKVENL
jgi:hypothetical protein